jgi:hypothetical protein
MLSCQGNSPEVELRNTPILTNVLQQILDLQEILDEILDSSTGLFRFLLMMSLEADIGALCRCFTPFTLQHVLARCPNFGGELGACRSSSVLCLTAE